MASVAIAAIGLDIFETFDVTGDLTFEVTFDFETFDKLADSVFLLNSEILWLGTGIDFDCLLNMERARTTDAVDDGEADFHSFIFWECNTEDSHNVYWRLKIEY